MKFEAAINAIHSKYWDAEIQASIGKTVLLVEGEDDKGVLEAILDALVRRWDTHFRVVAAGSAEKVIRERTRFPRRYLLIDRDTRSDAEVAAMRRDESSLYVTKGWCLENLFLVPSFVASLGDESLTNHLEGERERWVRAGALWWTLRRAREASQRWWDGLWRGGRYGCPRDGCEPTSAKEFSFFFAAIAPLGVDIDGLGAEFEARLADVLAMRPADQWRVGVHGKAAFKHFFGRTRWDRRALASRLSQPLPSPLDELVALARV